jgi:hypothetical protein
MTSHSRPSYFFLTQCDENTNNWINSIVMLLLLFFLYALRPIDFFYIYEEIEGISYLN